MLSAATLLYAGEWLDRTALFPQIAPAGRSPAQVLPSGPGYGHENGENLIVSLLYAARERVVITTPYFVPDQPFLQALATACVRGVDVHLVLSALSNQLVTNLAQESYYELLLAGGVRIHLYEPHFLHAKHLAIDRSIALIGSTNIDIRSFALNADVSLLVYDAEVVKAFEAIQARYFAASRLLATADWAARPLRAKVAQNTARLTDSLL